MGGHAPIIGAEVYVFQAGQTGYASAPTNEMASGQQGTDPTLGKYVLTTAPSGAFLITGDYTPYPNAELFREVKVVEHAPVVLLALVVLVLQDRRRRSGGVREKQ